LIKIIIADDHPVVRRGLKQILADTPDLVATDEAGSGGQLLEKLSKGSFDCVLLDLSMPGMHGLDALPRIKRDYPNLPVLVLSIHPEDQFARRALKAGASGYLPKESSTEELVTAIRRVCSGRKYLSPSMAGNMAERISAGAREEIHETLSPREFQVTRRLADGKGIKEIATELSLSVKTVSTYRARILVKLNIKTNAELTRYTMQHGLLD
jgi:two-component system invasion response regulator UvrY